MGAAAETVVVIQAPCRRCEAGDPCVLHDSLFMELRDPAHGVPVRVRPRRAVVVARGRRRRSPLRVAA
jgi:hypothetical protein